MTIPEKYDKVDYRSDKRINFPIYYWNYYFLFSSGDMSLGSYLCQTERFKYYYTFNYLMCFPEYFYFSDI